MPDAIITYGWSNSDAQRGADQLVSISQATRARVEKILGGVGSGVKFGIGALGLGSLADVGTQAISVLKGVADEFDHINDLSQRLKIAPEAMQRIAAQAKLSGSDVDTAAKALLKFNRELESADGKAAFAELNIDAAAFKALSPEKQLAELAAKFQDAEEKGKGLKAVFAILGRSGDELLPLLRADKKALADMAAVKVISSEQIAQIAVFNDKLDAAIMRGKATIAELAVTYGARAAQMLGALAGIGGGWLLVTAGKWVAGIAQQKTAVDGATAALSAETAALKANTTAQEANMVARTGNRGGGVARPSYAGKGGVTATGSAGGLNTVIDFSSLARGAEKGGGSMVDSFVRGTLTRWNGASTLILSTLSAAFLDRSKAIGGQMGAGVTDGLSFALSTLGPYGVLASTALQLIQGAHILGTEMGEAIAARVYAGMDRTAARGTADIQASVEKGNLPEARLRLEMQIADARALAAKASGDEKQMLDAELAVLENMSAHFDSWAQRVQNRVAAERAATDAMREQEKIAAHMKAKYEERQKALVETRDLMREIESKKISALPEDQKLAALKNQRAAMLADAQISTPFGAGANSADKLIALARSQKNNGQEAASVKTLERAKAVLEVEQQIAELQQRADKAAADKKKDAGEAGKKAAEQKQLLQIEQEELAVAQMRAAGRSKEAEQLQRHIDLQKQARQLADQLNISQEEALKLATARAAAERQLGDLVKAKSQTTAKEDLAGQMAVLSLRSSGRGKEADELQRQLDILKQTRQIQQETGLSQSQAFAIAQRKSDLEKQAGDRASRDAQPREDGRHRIQGYHGGDADEARARAEANMARVRGGIEARFDRSRLHPERSAGGDLGVRGVTDIVSLQQRMVAALERLVSE